MSTVSKQIEIVVMEKVYMYLWTWVTERDDYMLAFYKPFFDGREFYSPSKLKATRRMK